MKKVIEDLNVFRKYFRVRQEVSDEIQTSISFIKAELQAFNESLKFIFNKEILVLISSLTSCLTLKYF